MNAKKTIREQARALRAELGPAPTPDELVSYHFGELEDADRRRVRAYLAVSPEAAETVLDMARFAELEPDPAEQPDDFEASWQRLRQRVAERPPVESVREAVAMPAPAGSRRWQLAAMLVLGLGLGWPLTSLLHGPAIVTQPAEIGLSAGVSRSGDGSTLVVPADADRVIVHLSHGSLGVADSWQLEIWRWGAAAAKPVRQLSIARQRGGNFTFTLPPDLLPSGRYELRLFGISAGERTQRESYELEVEKR